MGYFPVAVHEPDQSVAPPADGLQHLEYFFPLFGITVEVAYLLFQQFR